VRRLLAAGALLALAGCATTATTRAPVREGQGKGAPVVDGDVTFGQVGEVQVLVRRWPGAELVATTLAIRGGVQDLPPDLAGVELLGLRTAASGGTALLDKDAFSRKLSKLGGALEAGAAPDYSTLEAKSLRADWQETLGLLLDVFLHPGLPDAELALQRERLLQELRREQESPDDALRFLADELLFRGTPYAVRPQGTEASVRALTKEAIASHLEGLRTQKRLLLVVVGDIEAEDVFALARKAFVALPAGGPLPKAPPAVHFAEPRLASDRRKLPTTYILASFAGPSWGAEDFAAMRLAASVLSEHEFLEVRSRRNLSYAPDVRLNTGRPQSFGGLYVSAVDPAGALAVMQSVVKELSTEPLSEEEFEGEKAAFLVEFFLTQETTDGAAQRLLEAQLLGGDWRLVRTLPERVRRLSPKDVQACVGRYVHNYQVAVVGNPDTVDLSLLR
jgi:zinc protease